MMHEAVGPGMDQDSESGRGDTDRNTVDLSTLDPQAIYELEQLNPAFLADRLRELLASTRQYLVQAMNQAPDTEVERGLAMILTKVEQLEMETTTALVEAGLSPPTSLRTKAGGVADKRELQQQSAVGSPQSSAQDEATV